jgi:hypothetical protein
MLTDLHMGTKGYTWIAAFKRSQDGQATWLALNAHYDGGGNRENIVSQAEAILCTIMYKNELAFLFENFSSKLLQVYRDLAKYERPKTPYQQVQELLDKIKINEARVEVAKAHVRQNFREDVNGAVEFLGTEFADMYPEATFLGRQSCFISAAGQKECDSQRQRTGNGNQPQTQPDVTIMYNGVDVTDIQCDFSTQETTALRQAGQRYMFYERREPGSGNSFSDDRSYSS